MADRFVGSGTIHLTGGLLAGMVFVSICVSVVFGIEIVSRGHGRVVPASRIQVVQPEVQGAIREIHVRDGDLVRKNDVLISLDRTKLQSETRTVTMELERREIEAARLRSSLTALAHVDPAQERFVAKGLAHFEANTDTASERTVQRALLEAFLLALTGTSREMDARAVAAQRGIDAARARLNKARLSHQMSLERLKAEEQLLGSGHTSRVRYLEALDSATSLAGDREVFQREIEERESRRAALTLERSSLLAGERQKLAEELATVDGEIHRLEQLVRAKRRILEATQLRAPVAGKVENLKVFSIGGVVQAGETLLNVVPVDDEAILEVQFGNADSGFLGEGQLAYIKLDAYPSERFGIVRGTVRKVSSDAVEVYGKWVYLADIEPTTQFIGTGSDRRRLLPGMTATVDIVTGERNLISYFFEPIVRAVQDGLGER